MSRVWTVARKELLDILRERSIVLALMAQLFVAAFSTFISVGLVSLYDPESIRGFPRSDLAYVGPGGFDEYLGRVSNLDVENLDFDAAVAAFNDGRFAAVIEETWLEAEGKRTVTILLADGEPQSSLIVAQVKGLLRDYERDLRLERSDRIDEQVLYVETDARPSAYYGFTFGVLVPLLVLTPVFLSGAIVGDSFSAEIQGQTLRLLRSSPLRIWEIVVGKMAAPLLLVPAQALLWIVLIQANGIHLANVPWLLVLAFLMGLLLASLGVIIALMSRQVGPTQELYTLLVLVLFAAGLLMPQDPLNLIARLAAGSADAVSRASMGIVAAAAAVAFAATLWVAHRRLTQEEA